MRKSQPAIALLLATLPIATLTAQTASVPGSGPTNTPPAPGGVRGGTAPRSGPNPMNALVQQGFDHFYNLEYDDSVDVFRREAAQRRDSPDAYNHLAQAVLFRLMFRTGALESQLVTGNNPFLTRAELKPTPAESEDFQKSIDRALMLASSRIQSNPNDAAAYYAQGVSLGLRSSYNFLVRKAWVDALKDSTAARKAHNRTTQIDPSFVDAQMVQGAYDYVVGSLPFTWKMLGFLAGFRGDKNRGIQTLRYVMEHGQTNSSDAAVLLCAILRREHRASETLPLLDDLVHKYPRNYLFRLEMVQMYGDLGDKEKALTVIAEVERLRQTQAPGYENLSEEKVRYTRGNLLFWYNDLDHAREDIKTVVARPEAVDLNTAVYAHLRLGQIHDLKGERQEALSAYRGTIEFAADSDAAREAESYLRNPFKRKG